MTSESKRHSALRSDSIEECFAVLRNPKSLGWAREVALKRIEEQLEALERFEDDVRDVMDFMPQDKHYHALNEALGRIRGSNPAKERQ